MGENHISVVVNRIRPKLWWMLPMGVRDNHTKYEPETQRWRPGTGVTSAGPPFQNPQFGAKISLFLPKTALEPAKNGQMKGNSGYSTHAARLPYAEGTSRALELHNLSANRPQKAPKVPRICAHWPPTAPNPKKDHILGYVAQNAVSSAPSPPATTHFWCSRLQEVAQRGGCQNGSTRSTGRKKMTCSKNDPRPHGMPKQVFWARFELVVARFGPPKIPKCLENGPLWDKKWVNSGSKMCFSKNDSRPLGVPKQVK